MAFDLVFRWLQETGIRRNPDNQDFFHPTQCADADDFAGASSSIRELIYALALAFRSVDYIAGLSWCGNEEHDSLRTRISETCEEFRELHTARHAEYVGTMIGPDGHIHRWTAPRKIWCKACLK